MIKLLIVEDSEETVDLIRLILSNETDIKVSDANTIKDGMNLVKKDIFDLILLDLSLPDGNGTYKSFRCQYHKGWNEFSKKRYF